jgi:hypothetical protein
MGGTDMKQLPYFIVGVMLLIIAVAATGDGYKLQAKNLAGKQAPELKLNTVMGNALPASTFQNKARLVIFLSLNLKESVNLVKQLDKLSELRQNPDLKLVVVDITNNPGLVQKFLSNHELGYDIYLAESKVVMMDWHVRFLPTVFLVDKNNLIQNTIEHPESMHIKKLVEKLEEMIKE